jgi:hypothetical protein
VELPLAARRLFGAPGDGEGACGGGGGGDGQGGGARLDPASPDPCVLALLLEDGDRADLAWLCRQLPEGALAAWVERHGARRLSRRSLAFWAVVLEHADLQPERLPELARRRALWPL